jgi:SnoaL-like domain
MNAVRIAEAFSGHRFPETYPHLSPNVHWTVIGASTLDGRDAVVAACERSATELAGVTTTFRAFRSIASGDTVVVESLADYVDADGGTTTVASCDIYDFDGDLLVRITSYNLVPVDVG